MTAPRMGTTEWLILIALSIPWGGSFFFVEVALAHFGPLTIVASRVLLGALALGEAVGAGAAVGMGFIGLGLVVVDGRLPRAWRRAPGTAPNQG